MQQYEEAKLEQMKRDLVQQNAIKEWYEQDIKRKAEEREQAKKEEREFAAQEKLRNAGRQAYIAQRREELLQ